MKKAVIDIKKCVGCGACIKACPQQAIRMLPGWHCQVDPDRCTGCGTCVRLCHKGAPALAEESRSAK